MMDSVLKLWNLKILQPSTDHGASHDPIPQPPLRLFSLLGNLGDIDVQSFHVYIYIHRIMNTYAYIHTYEYE